MKTLFTALLISSALFFSSSHAHTSDEDHKFIHFATSPEYPPFEYSEHGELKGFDIDLARLIAKKLGKEAMFDCMQFSSILPALTSNQVDAAIATLTVTEQRQKNFDFTRPYYFERLAAVFFVQKPVKNAQEIKGKNVAVQLGSTMEIWLKNKIPEAHLLVVDNNNQAIAALKAGHADLVLMDGAQSVIFSKKNPGLSFANISQSSDGYGIALKMHSALTPKINQALQALEQSGELDALKQKWFGGDTWKN